MGASSTNNGGFPGASTVSSRSQANTLLPPFALPSSLQGLCPIGLTVILLVVGLAMTDLVRRDQANHSVIKPANGSFVKPANIHLVEDSGRVIVGDLHREVRVIKSSGRRFSNGLVLDGKKVWERNKDQVAHASS